MKKIVDYTTIIMFYKVTSGLSSNCRKYRMSVYYVRGHKAYNHDLHI